MYTKCCFVPECGNTTTSTPDKIFFHVPKTEPLRSKWLKAARRDTKKLPLSPLSTLHCCEDHFDLEQDMRNLMQYKLLKSSGISVCCFLNKGVVPHKFTCQKGRLVTFKKRESSVLSKLHRKKLIEELLKTKEPTPSMFTGVRPELSNTETPTKCNVGTQANTIPKSKVSKRTQAKPDCWDAATETQVSLMLYASEGIPPSKVLRLNNKETNTCSRSTVAFVEAIEWTLNSSSESDSD